MNNNLFNIEIEKSILATVIFEPSKFDEVLEFGLSAEDFYIPTHQDIYKAIKSLNDRDLPIDEEFVKRDLIKAGRYNENTLLEVLIANPTSKVEHYLKDIKDKANLRRLISISNQVKINIADGFNGDEVIASVNGAIKAIEDGITTNFKPQTLSDAINDFNNMPLKPKYQTGIDLVDNYFNGGLELNQLIMLGGAKGAGKTAFSLQFLFNVSNGFKSAFLSFEMPIWKIASRSKKANLSQTQKNNIYLLDKGRDIREIEITVKSLARQGVKFFTIDSLMKITNKHNGGKRHEQISDITGRLSKLCIENEIIIILIVQVSNEDIKSNHMAVKGSGDADYDADIMFFIQKDKDEANKRYFICEKNRQNGNEFKQEVYFNSQSVSLQGHRPSIYEATYTSSIDEDNTIKAGFIL